MGYDVKLIKPKELDSKFVPVTKHSNSELQENIEETKLEIIIYCMQSHDKIELKVLRFKLMYLILLLEDSEKHYIKQRFDECDSEEANEDEKNGFWISGWQYSRECDFTKEDVINRVLKDLSTYAYLVKTPDYFDEHEKFYEKLNDLETTLDIDSEISDIVMHELLEMYKGEESY